MGHHVFLRARGQNRVVGALAKRHSNTTQTPQSDAMHSEVFLEFVDAIIERAVKKATGSITTVQTC
ncbi:hypothetical protein [Paraburkholderia dilworthii]|uniref:hypothetical protein n=1 Tax=Paraburkholderia dilworthii TaxID=948106 RepID=UPI001267C4E3|nr:hypothetical protein [Paraburkholderia dilworthii]